MSYLLDALKQSEQGDPNRSVPYSTTASVPYLQQQGAGQKDLNFYRKLAFSLSVILMLLFTLSVGFFAGSWFQENKIRIKAIEDRQAQVSRQAVDPVKPVQMQPAPIPAMIPAMIPAGMPAAATHYQLVPVTTAYNSRQINNGAQFQASAQQQGKAEVIDYTKYKLVGKPIDGALEQPRAKVVNHEDNALLAQVGLLPASLKTAFANAVAATENFDEYQVTKATKRSALAQPIELLSDVILSLIPKLTYQAHIYASEADKRWIKLNNTELYEGDSLGQLKVIEIASELTVLSVDGYHFSLPAMSDWEPPHYY